MQNFFSVIIEKQGHNLKPRPWRLAMDKRMRIFFIYIFLTSQLGVYYASIPAMELDALVQFKMNHMVKRSQHLLWSWDAHNASSVCESWVGIACISAASGHHIQGISLPGFGLEGSIPPHLGNLTFLENLNLSSNAFTGSIPWQLMGCSSLQTLDLKSNVLIGHIPASLAALSSIQVLDLCENNLSGPIPSALFTNMSNFLEYLGLCSNTLSGSLTPANLGLHLPKLQYLLVSQNNLTGVLPPSLGNSSNLLHIRLFSNLFTGPIPTKLGLLQNLRGLSLYQNKLTGSVPPSLGNCTNLIYLELDSNRLSGSIPAELGMLRSLQYLSLQGNNLTGVIPLSLFKNYTSLSYVGLSSNQLTGAIPAEVGLLHNLQQLDLYMNNLTTIIPPSLGNCTSLLTLQLHYNQLTGPVPTQLGLLGDVITTLTLFGNQLVGAVPSILGNLSNIQVLEFGDNLLSGTIPVTLGLLGNAEVIGLDQNSFRGVIPPSLGNCTSLVYLHLDANQLSGPIPASFIMLGQLQRLSLDSNHLSGSLQGLDLSNFTKLTQMWLHDNQLHGSLSPIQFSRLQQLRDLDLSNNQFTGEIPWESLANCTFLYNLDLSNNQLNGAIPSNLGGFKYLQILHLELNLLWGGIPSFNGLNLLELDLAFNHLNGSLPPSLAPSLVTLVSYLNLSHNGFSGSLPPWLGQLVKVEEINLSNNNFTGGIPEDLGDCVGLAALYLSNNHLSGDLPPDLGNLAYLDTLELSYNNFSGVLPSFLGTQLLRLQMLNVSFNNFTGPISTDEGVFRHLDASCFQGNPGLCGKLLNKTCINSLSQKQHGHHIGLQHLKNWRGILLLAFILALVLTGLVLLLLILQNHCLSRNGDAPAILTEARRYSAKELMEATQGYADVNILGQGNLGVVYKAVLSDSKVVAIKKLKDIYNGSDEALLKEMHILRKLRHRNLVQILGCVLNLDMKALVLQYMANGSLEQYLDMHHIQDYESAQTDERSLKYWQMVSRVSMGIAHALAYLHHGYGESIIHGDVKPGNILLDSDLEPHLADFGLAKIIQRGAESVSLTSELKGSIGYMAPEYAYAARVTTKADIYSYGVVVLRMLTGKSPTEVVPEGVSLHEWVKSKLDAEGGDPWEEVLDASLLPKNPYDANTHGGRGNQVDIKGVQQLLHLGLACTSQRPEERPTIHEVLTCLTSHHRIPLPNYEDLIN